MNEHLETCADCQRGLERLAAGSGFWGELRQLKPRLGARPDRSDIGARNGAVRRIRSA